MATKAELLEEIHNLQKALNFWLPSVDPNAREQMVDRVAHDAYLLSGYDGELETTAEELGWIKWASR